MTTIIISIIAYIVGVSVLALRLQRSVDPFPKPGTSGLRDEDVACNMNIDLNFNICTVQPGETIGHVLIEHEGKKEWYRSVWAGNGCFKLEPKDKK